MEHNLHLQLKRLRRWGLQNWYLDDPRNYNAYQIHWLSFDKYHQ